MNKVYAIADLHGQYNLWRKVIAYLDETDTLYILGDCGDRGPDGWKIIKEALRDPRVVYIRGNHDQMLLDSWRSDWMDNHLWFWNGGYETFEAILDDNGPDLYLHELAKTNKYETYKNTNGQLIHLTHAGFTPGSDRFDPLWDREHFGDAWPKGRENEFVVYGHTWCGSSVHFGANLKLNKTKTVGRYCNGHKICIDGRSFIYHRIALLDLDTLEETVFLQDEPIEDN